MAFNPKLVRTSTIFCGFSHAYFKPGRARPTLVHVADFDLNLELESLAVAKSWLQQNLAETFCFRDDLTRIVSPIAFVQVIGGHSQFGKVSLGIELSEQTPKPCGSCLRVLEKAELVCSFCRRVSNQKAISG